MLSGNSNVPEYQFPEISDLSKFIEKFRKATSPQLITAVSKLTNKTSVSPKNDYDGDLRLTYCALNIVLNERNLIAPAFRPFRRLQKNIGLSIDEVNLGGDRQVIDLHYLYCNHRAKVRPSDRGFKPIFSNEDFDFMLASSFAGMEWRSGHKATKSLGLIPSIQMELAMIKERRVKDGENRIRRLAAEAKMGLEELSRKPRSRFRAEDIPDRVEQFVCLKYGKGSPSVAVEFLALRTGIKSPDDKAELRGQQEMMRKRKVWFQEKLGISKW